MIRIRLALLLSTLAPMTMLFVPHLDAGDPVDARAHENEPTQTTTLASPPSMAPLSSTVITGVSATSVPLQEVWWTAAKGEPVLELAERWGIPASELLALNPAMKRTSVVSPGTTLKVYRASPERPPRSIGTPNRGRLVNGIPLPEGPAWRLRDVRNRIYGTDVTIGALVETFRSYGNAFPDGPPILVGDISRRRGGRASPHVSHRTGRDVDIGFLLTGTFDDPERWHKATSTNFDAEKNWFLVRSLVESGSVQTIYMSYRVQRLLLRHARKFLSPEELPRYFRTPDQDPQDPAVLRHSPGHRDHMHVRFRCDPSDSKCRSDPRGSKRARARGRLLG